MPDQAPAGLEEPLLEARQRPTLNGGGQDEPTQEIAEVVGDDPEEQPDLVGPEPVAGEARPVGGFFALLDPLLGRPALVVETDDRSVGPGERGDDEAYPREQFAEVMLDLGNHSARTIPGSRLVVEAPVADEWSVAGPAPGSGEQILDAPLQDIVGRQADRIPHPPVFQRLVDGRKRKRRIRADDDRLPPPVVSINDGQQNLAPPVRTVDVPRAKLRRETVAHGVEDEERVIAARHKVPLYADCS